MLDNYFIEKLLGLKDLILINIEDSCDSKIIECKMKQKNQEKPSSQSKRKHCRYTKILNGNH